MCILKIANLNFSYDKEKYGLKDINLDFKEGKAYGIFGKSGAGRRQL